MDMSKTNQSLISPTGELPRSFERVLSALGIFAYSIAAVIVIAALFVNVDAGYVAQAVPALAGSGVESGLALLVGLPLP